MTDNTQLKQATIAIYNRYNSQPNKVSDLYRVILDELVATKVEGAGNASPEMIRHYVRRYRNASTREEGPRNRPEPKELTVEERVGQQMDREIAVLEKRSDLSENDTSS